MKTAACLRTTHRQACAVKDMEGAYQKVLVGKNP
jgi:hypothetical protein